MVHWQSQSCKRGDTADTESAVDGSEPILDVGRYKWAAFTDVLRFPCEDELVRWCS